jgi:hypothetical protein
MSFLLPQPSGKGEALLQRLEQKLTEKKLSFSDLISGTDINISMQEWRSVFNSVDLKLESELDVLVLLSALKNKLKEIEGGWKQHSVYVHRLESKT